MSASDANRKVVLYTLLSLDGVAEEPGDWFFEDSPELYANLSEVIGTQDDVLLGRGTYDYWAPYWPRATDEPFASFINGVTKHVVTSRELDGAWANSTQVTAPVAEYLVALKAEPGRDIGVHASIALAQSLLRDRLVDEIRLVVAPTMAGHGRRLFPDDDALARLELFAVERSAGGTLFLGYRRAA